MSTIISLADAKARFSAQVRRAESGEVVVITRHGRPVVALVPVEDVAHLERLRAAGPEKGLASLAGGWDDSDELVERIHSSERVGMRTVPELD